MKKEYINEMVKFIEHTLNQPLNPCQIKLLEHISSSDRSIGFVKMSFSLVDLYCYTILWDIFQNDVTNIYINLGDDSLNELAFETITSLILDNDLFHELGIHELSDITEVGDMLVIDDIYISTSEQMMSNIDKYYIYDMVNNQSVVDIIDNIMYDEEQPFVVMDSITKHVLFDSKFDSVTNSLIYTVHYSEYNNCNSEIIQTSNRT